jgi:Pyrimidine dimer DNA glycosylase
MCRSSSTRSERRRWCASSSAATATAEGSALQTFLPYADFAASAAVLDDRRLGKQRVETLQILRALVFPSYKGWKNHPATRMWRGFTPALVAYGLAVCAEWSRRGRADAVAQTLVEFSGGETPDVGRLRRSGALPPWLGLEQLHVSHRSSLVRKLPEHYRRYFPDVPDDLPYVWPPSVFPRWPVPRSGLVSVDDAFVALGWRTPRPGQREAVEQLVDGRDVTLSWPAGAGASSVGLLAALCRPGVTLWLSAHLGGTDFEAPPLSELQVDAAPPVTSKTSTSIARPPTADDVAAMQLETAPPEFLFHRSEDLARRDVRSELRGQPVSLIVCDGVPKVRRMAGAPILEIHTG